MRSIVKKNIQIHKEQLVGAISDRPRAVINRPYIHDCTYIAKNSTISGGVSCVCVTYLPGGASRLPPVAGERRRASGSGRQDASLLRQAQQLPGTATG